MPPLQGSEAFQTGLLHCDKWDHRWMFITQAARGKLSAFAMADLWKSGPEAAFE
jgi:hypothetical protein